jgi:hypothetical protein
LERPLIPWKAASHCSNRGGEATRRTRTFRLTPVAAFLVHLSQRRRSLTMSELMWREAHLQEMHGEIDHAAKVVEAANNEFLEIWVGDLHGVQDLLNAPRRGDAFVLEEFELEGLIHQSTDQGRLSCPRAELLRQTSSATGCHLWAWVRCSDEGRPIAWRARRPAAAILAMLSPLLTPAAIKQAVLSFGWEVNSTQ